MKSIPVAVLMAAVFGLAQTPLPSGAVEGTVVDSTTGVSIGGASVVLSAIQSTVQSPGRPARYETTSDGAGHFKITGIAPGSYRTRVEKDGFSSRPSDFNLFSLPELRVTFNGDPVKVQLKLTALTTIAGRVFGLDGKPIASVEVVMTPNITADLAVTDSEGRFALKDILPGSYKLVARLPDSAKPEEAADGTRTAMVATYYPSVANESLAEPIVVPGQGNYGSYEIRMQTAQVHRVRGIVRDEEGRPSRGVELTLYPLPEGVPGMGMALRPGGSSLFALGVSRAPSGTGAATAITGEDGRFEFPAVRSGDWRIKAVSDPLRDPQDGPRGTAGVLVGRGDVDDLQIQLATPFKLTGVVEWKGDLPTNLQLVNPDRRAIPVTLINADNNELVTLGIAGPEGLLFENVLPGRYRVMVAPGLSAQVFLGDIEATGAFSIKAGGPRLRLVLKTWAGTVRGTVERGEGATVVLVPQRFEGVASGHTVLCGAGGSFELSDVTPGDYYIAAFDRVDRLSVSAAMLSLMSSRGTSVRVEERLTANVLLSSMITAAR